MDFAALRLGVLAVLGRPPLTKGATSELEDALGLAFLFTEELM